VNVRQNEHGHDHVVPCGRAIASATFHVRTFRLAGLETYNVASVASLIGLVASNEISGQADAAKAASGSMIGAPRRCG
jgi:hypothetical protein